MCDKIALLLIYEKVALLSPASGALGLRNDAISCLISHNTAGHTQCSSSSVRVLPENTDNIYCPWGNNMDWWIYKGINLKHLGIWQPTIWINQQLWPDWQTPGNDAQNGSLFYHELTRGFHRSLIHFLPTYWTSSSIKVNVSTPTLYSTENWL